MANLDFFQTYVLSAINKEIEPEHKFFRDRYFPTGAGDIFTTNKVLTEYKNADRKVAAFVAQNIGDIPMDRLGYEIHEYEPARIAVSRLLTLDMLKQRGFGEAIYANSTEAERAVALIADDMKDMEARISRREEWMCSQVLINNACTMQTYVDASTQGEQLYVQYYNTTSDHTYSVSPKWDATNGDFFSDVAKMCRKLAKRGLPCSDLILGSDAADAILKLEEVRDLLNVMSGVRVGEKLEAELTKYDGVVLLGVLNFNGHRLNVFSVDEQYVADNGTETAYFPAKGALVTAPNCGHMMYGSVTQYDYNATMPSTYALARVPKLSVDQDNDIRKLRLTTRPLAAPITYCPYIYAANVVS